MVSFEEDNFFGKTRYTWHDEAAGDAAVWATANSREALRDALKRRETYGTSGTRMMLRRFAGWSDGTADAKVRRLADVGHRKGVPRGVSRSAGRPEPGPGRPPSCWRR